MTPGSERHLLSQKARRLDHLHLGDDTRMAEGISLAYAEICENRQEKVASRIILLTDGFTQDIRESYEWAKRAKEKGLAITTMGLGTEFNEDLLIPIADTTGGNAYYIEKPDQIPDAFRKELGAALGIVYHNLKLNLRNTPGVELRRVHRVLPELGNIEITPSNNEKTTCFLGHYDPGLPPALLLEFTIPPWGNGSYRMTEAMLSWEGENGGSATHSITADIVIQMEDSVEEIPNTKVMEVVKKVGAFNFGIYALESAEKSDQTTAVRQLKLAATQLEQVGESSLAADMAETADRLQNRGKLDSMATKRLKYETRMISRKS
jgi:Ca-activated chloride channel family protein